MKTVLSAGISQLRSVRIAAADCLRALGVVLPSRASYLANQCMDLMKKYRTNADAVHGAGYVSCCSDIPSYFQRCKSFQSWKKSHLHEQLHLRELLSAISGIY